jgi:hypothetical protein
LLVQLQQQAQALHGEWEQHRQQLLQWVEEAETMLTAKQVGGWHPFDYGSDLFRAANMAVPLP